MRVPCSMLAALSVVLTPQTAEACSPAECGPGILLPQGGSIPQNAPGMYWEPWSGPVTDPERQVHLYRLTAGGEEELELEIQSVPRPGAQGSAFVIRPAHGWVRGARYRAEASQNCGTSTRSPLATTFEVARRAPLPRSLGRLTMSNGEGELAVRTWAGRCSEHVPAVWSDVTLAHSRGARPWRELFLYRTRVGSRAWQPSVSLGSALPRSGESWVGRGQDRIFSRCWTAQLSSADPGLPSGQHRVRMAATLPGTDIDLESRSAGVTLTCSRPARTRPEIEELLRRRQP